MRTSILTVTLLFVILYSAFSVIVPNPIISRGRTVYTSSGNATYLADNKFNTTKWNVTNNSWIAIQIDSGPAKVFFTWNNDNYTWSDSVGSYTSCKQHVAFPVNYIIQTSANSTNGSDGNWVTKDSIVNNIVTARGHLVDFAGAKWIKMAIIKGGGTFDEIEVFDASNGTDDTWFFAGTSISAATYKQNPPAKNFADLIHEAHSDFNPTMIRGGIPCINSTDLINNLSQYINRAGNVHFWAIEMGTNDAWGGTNANVTLYKQNMQRVIDSCKKYGIQPIIAHILATNPKYTTSPAGWQIHPDYYKAVDDLTTANNLIAGPDLYNWFLAHPEELNGSGDGVHPNATGAASIQRLWTLATDSLYGGCSPVQIIPYIKVNSAASKLIASAIVSQNDTIVLSPQTSIAGTWSWSGPASFTSTAREITLNQIQVNQGGYYTVSFTRNDTCHSAYSFKLTVKPLTDVKSTVPESENIRIFPNPAFDGNFKIFINDFSGTYQMQVYNILGKLSFSEKLTKNETTINTKLPKGIYVVNIYNGQFFFNQKLILK